MKKNTGKLTKLSLLLAIEIVIALVPMLSFPPIPGMSMTTLHIPVLIAAVALGPLEGGILGFVFGCASLMVATFPTDPVAAATGYLFSPFVNGGNWWSLVVCFVPRILLGVVGGLIFKALRRLQAGTVPTVLAATAVGCLLHSFLVLFFIYLFFSAFPLREVFLGIIGINALIELVAALVIVTAVARPLLRTKS